MTITLGELTYPDRIYAVDIDLCDYCGHQQPGTEWFGPYLVCTKCATENHLS